MEDNKIVHGYKIINPDWTCRGKQYCCPGVFEEEEIDICQHGMHFCERLSDCFMYYSDSLDNHYVEVEAFGTVQVDFNKCCTDKLRIIKELTLSDIIEILTAERKEESNNFNWGLCNDGSYNRGMYNRGFTNIGDYNNGQFNWGDVNYGTWNLGHRNIGVLNQGSGNRGSYNKGTNAIGYFNGGTDATPGVFNTENKGLIMFNKPCDWTIEDFVDSDAYSILQDVCHGETWDTSSAQQYPEQCTQIGDYIVGWAVHKRDIDSCRQKKWDNLLESEQNKVLSLPNFDVDVFKQCTGIDASKAWNKKCQDSKDD